MATQEKRIPKKRGRPATGRGTGVMVRLPDPLLEALDAWIAQRPEKITRPQAIRLLAQAALDAGFGLKP